MAMLFLFIACFLAINRSNCTRCKGRKRHFEYVRKLCSSSGGSGSERGQEKRKEKEIRDTGPMLPPTIYKEGSKEKSDTHTCCGLKLVKLAL